MRSGRVRHRYLSSLNNGNPSAFTSQSQSHTRGKSFSAAPRRQTQSHLLNWDRNHQVEGVRLWSMNQGVKYPLHPSIAIVSRRSGEDYILRDTGQVIGNEDQGIVELYRHLLGCDSRGVSLSTGQAEEMAMAFWEGFKERLVAHDM